jgi:hypothetical protein
MIQKEINRQNDLRDKQGHPSATHVILGDHDYYELCGWAGAIQGAEEPMRLSEICALKILVTPGRGITLACLPSDLG